MHANSASIVHGARHGRRAATGCLGGQPKETQETTEGSVDFVKGSTDPGGDNLILLHEISNTQGG